MPAQGMILEAIPISMPAYSDTMPIIQGMMMAPLLAAGSIIPMLAALVIRPALATAVGFMPAMAKAKANSRRMAVVWVLVIIRPM